MAFMVCYYSKGHESHLFYKKVSNVMNKILYLIAVMIL